MKKNKLVFSKGAIYFIVFCFLCLNPSFIWAMSSTKDTLETSRSSFHGELDGNHTAGTTLITIDTADVAVPSRSTANLFPGDVIAIDTGSYTVDNIVSSSQFTITAPLAAADDDDGDIIYKDITSTHVITYTTGAAIPNGAIKVRVVADSVNHSDNDPDDGGFDYNSITAGDVSCPTDANNYNFVTATATASAGAGCTAGYHCFECRYSGVGMTSVNQTITIGNTNELMNPSLGTGHTAGQADTHSIIIDNLDAADTQVAGETTNLKVAVIESVRVTATIEPTITFTIAAVASAQTRCGATTDVGTTPTAVPFGSLTLGAFNDAAQQLSCVTNGAGGYVVTVIENDQLSIDGEHGTELSDTDCDSADCTETVEAEWDTDTTESGFGFSIQDIDANSVPFEYTTATGNCSGSYCARRFPSTADGGESATGLMSNSSTPASTEDIYMCYRMVASTTQQAGDYENFLTYVATATF
ncbi:hypothetical protein ACFLZ1_03850 [Patescibacteria group bacterium]